MISDKGRQPPRLRALPGRHGRARQLPRPDHDLPRHAAARLRARPRPAARQVTRTVRHELAHHLGADELGVRELGPVMIVMTPTRPRREIAAVRARLETTGVHVLVMPGELTTAIGAIGDPEGVRELGPRGHGGRRPRRPDLAALQARVLRAHPPRADVVRHRRAHASAATDVLPDRRAVHGRVARADAGASRARSRPPAPSMLRGGAFKPRTSPFAFKGLGRAGAGDPRRGARGDRPAGRHRAARHPARRRDRRARRRHPDRRAQHAELRAARGRRQARQAGAAQARALVVARRAADGGGLHPQGGQRARDAVRARDPHVRDRDALHARPLGACRG